MPGTEKSLGEKIREARESRRLSRREAAELTGLNDQYIYQVETSRRVPPLETLWDLATKLGIDPSDLDDRLASRESHAKPAD